MTSEILLLLAGVSCVSASSNIAAWNGLRGAIIQNVVVLEGGSLTKSTWNDNTNTFGIGGGTVDVSNGLYKNLSLCNAIDVSNQNTDDLLVDPWPSPEYSDSDWPVYIAGGLFHNNHQFYTYGGMPDRNRVPGLSNVMRMDVYPFVASATRGSVGPHFNQSLPDGITDFVTSGAYTSSPDQNLGFYFSGMQSASGGELGSSLATDTDPKHPSTPTTQFLKINMQQSDNATWTNLSWPSWLAPRSEGALVWLPFGDEGILLAIGGVQIPGDLFMSLPKNATTSSNTAGPFMSQVSVYDIASDEWYLQDILGGTQPSQLAGFCAVVAETQDKSSYSIYVYGGYDGTYITNQKASDEVWVLSVPSFQWTRVSTGDTNHRRKGHICVAPNPTTMMSVGGTVELGSYLTNDRSIDFFDLNSLIWTGKFDPTSTKQYELPSIIAQQIGGSSTGLGSASLPPGLNSSLSSILSNKYNKVRTAYQPYNCSSSGTGKNNPSGINTVSKPSSHNALIGGVVGGVVVGMIIGALIFWCCKKNKKSKQAKQAGIARTQMRQNKVTSWFRRGSAAIDPEPVNSETTDRTSSTMVDQGGYFTQRISKTPYNQIYEAPPSNVTSPGFYSPGTPAHGTPYVTSPHLSGSYEVDGASSRHENLSRAELMDNSSTNRASMSIQNHPMYPLSVAGSHIISMKSQSISHPSDILNATQHRGQISPYELPMDRSNENLSQPPNDLNLDQDIRSMSDSSFGVLSNPIHSPKMMSPTTSIARKPFHADKNLAMATITTDDNRPGHQRNQSSMSSNFPTGSFPSPGPEEDKRRSKFIDALPDQVESSSVSPRSQRRQQGPVQSIYREEFDEADEKTQSMGRGF